jgi:hypothetical protein
MPVETAHSIGIAFDLRRSRSHAVAELTVSRDKGSDARVGDDPARRSGDGSGDEEDVGCSAISRFDPTFQVAEGRRGRSFQMLEMRAAKVWLITESTRGLRRALAKGVLETGHKLLATAPRS